MQRLALSIAVMIIALCAPAFGTSATELNNGTKLIIKEGTDSVFYTYQNYQDVWYAYSEGGSSWDADVVDETEHDHPTIAADSTGRRWIVARCPVIFPGFTVTQQAYYWNGSAWAGPQSIYSINPLNGDLGPASLDGAAFTSTSWAYSAFLVSEANTKRVVLTKFNGSTVAACTVISHPYLGDPSIAVEPYKADSNRIHITYECRDTIRYADCLDSRTSSSIGNVSLLNVGLDSVTVQHPSINADRGLVVVAYAKGSGEPDAPEIYARKRATSGSTWEDAGNLSNSYYNPSDWPTIAMGDAAGGVDTVVVAWEEAISAGDHDIYACINFDPDDVVNIADDDTFSLFPHATLQDAGDELYLHTIWSEPNYVVGYDKLDLRSGRREGQQCAASLPMTANPSLGAWEPNPFHGHARISYALPTANSVTLGVYDATGRPVRTLASGNQTAGNYSASWDARDAEGKRVPYGIYFCRLDTPGFRSVQKAVLTK